MVQPLGARLPRFCVHGLIGAFLWVPKCALADEFVRFVPPTFLAGPVISRAAGGNTYSFRGKPPHAQASLSLTQVEVPSTLTRNAIEVCATAFLEEIHRLSFDLFSQKVEYPLQVGPYALASWRWNGTLLSHAKTGVVSCGIIHGRFLAVTFEDNIREAPRSFFSIRETLKSMALGRQE